MEARPPRSLQLAPDAPKTGEVVQNRHQWSNVAIFLTGSTGYIGAHVAANLLEQHGASLNLLVAPAIRKRLRQSPVAGSATASGLSAIL